MKISLYYFVAIIPMLLVFYGATTESGNVRFDAFAQTAENSNENAKVLEQLVQNLTQAQSSVSNNDSGLATTQLTAIIGELSDIIGKITTDNSGQYLDTHTHYFTHKDHVHTVTHTHPHHADHHSHHESWTEKHHIFDPKNCKPGLMC
ncbi:MAG TPA: hypothetical protein VFG45_10720 [Candidatus Nitrosocosmicus sp.]|jgi:DNA polymerase III gamma/tau subunit|uniref:hypothetical protein n=1 Tax=Candidatus Nitrosocosmicus agrestis TaxID=2563600 RepID=UPI00122E163B|nr:hypothetical protein [Candidatus Nitrosocosmicus sp. SS]KAA2283202.1 hypothetical protein F1Z66_03750 [Candidatus Nitrosocosmicus sp. SS]KAF0868657.1 hypothetical protein E5N71_09775 [Candidatus Nitrosocosmicus sp. SS]MDR4489955.1 hypothetical protein [Candidatus Nitrosocosmicus sp.]HET6590623.1 hypothetical protein [Candidatus Nitrosocosmicus sp.]